MNLFKYFISESGYLDFYKINVIDIYHTLLRVHT